MDAAGFDGGFTVPVDDIEIAVRTRTAAPGSGPAAAVVLLHGLTDDGGCLAAPAGWFAAAGRFVAAPDAPGHGRSGLPARFTWQSRADAAEAVVRVVAADHGPVVLVGHSMGAESAAVVASRRPDLVRALVLEDPPWPGPGVDRGARHADAAAVATWIRGLQATDDAGRLAGAAAEGAWDAAELRAWAAAKAAVDVRVLDRGESWVEDGWPRLLAAVAAPTLLVLGDPDRGALVTPTAERLLLDAAPGRATAVRLDTGHSVRRDDPAGWYAAVAAFLQRVGA